MEILRTLKVIFTKKDCAKCGLVRMVHDDGSSFCTNRGQAELFKQWKHQYPLTSQPEHQSVKKCDHPKEFI